MATPYTPLLYHSNYGIGGSEFETLFEHLHRNNLKSCGLVDITFFGLHEFIKHAKQYDIKPLIGARIPFTEEKGNKSYLIVQNQEGYRNLCKIITEMSFKRIKIAYIKEHTSGIVLLTNSLK
jgi:DNA polymerase III alpha subunit